MFQAFPVIYFVIESRAKMCKPSTYEWHGRSYIYFTVCSCYNIRKGRGFSGLCPHLERNTAMKLIFVRHGDPDYTNDTITEKGRRDAELLAQRIIKWDVTDFYCSPLGRAKATAACTLDKLGRSAVTLDWMREFSYMIDDPITGRHGVPWDFVPSYWSNESLMFDQNRWVDTDVMGQNPQIGIKYKETCQYLDEFLAGYGYYRKDKYYQTDKEEIFLTSTVAPNGDTNVDSLVRREKEPVVVIFCHLGIICVVLSHLLNIPFPLLVHGFFLPTTSLTILSSEERWGREAYFRVQAMGDMAHLMNSEEPISSAGYFAKAFQG